jgi:hypothetical protein
MDLDGEPRFPKPLLWGGQMEAAAEPPRRPPNQNRRLPNQTNQPTKTTPQEWCTLIRPEVVHFEVTGDRCFTFQARMMMVVVSDTRE